MRRKGRKLSNIELDAIEEEMKRVVSPAGDTSDPTLKLSPEGWACRRRRRTVLQNSKKHRISQM